SQRNFDTTDSPHPLTYSGETLSRSQVGLRNPRRTAAALHQPNNQRDNQPRDEYGRQDDGQYPFRPLQRGDVSCDAATRAAPDAASNRRDDARDLRAGLHAHVTPDCRYVAGNGPSCLDDNIAVNRCRFARALAGHVDGAIDTGKICHAFARLYADVMTELS